MIEPDRILDGIAHTLEQTVLPAIENRFARGQLYAVLEVLTSLQGQVVWGGLLLENEAATLAILVEQAAAVVKGELGDRLRSYEGLSAVSLTERLREGRSLLCALIEGGHADGGALAAAVDEYLANDAIFKAMTLRPGRLAEISQG